MLNVFGEGRLTKDPELRYTQSGTACAKTSVAIQQGKDDTKFYRLVAWGKCAETLTNYSGKGKRVLIMGELKINEFEGKEYREIHVNKISIIDFKDQQTNNNSNDGFNAIEDDDDCPF